jgi:hypothetical protein
VSRFVDKCGKFEELKAEWLSRLQDVFNATLNGQDPRTKQFLTLKWSMLQTPLCGVVLINGFWDWYCLVFDHRSFLPFFVSSLLRVKSFRETRRN